MIIALLFTFWSSLGTFYVLDQNLHVHPHDGAAVAIIGAWYVFWCLAEARRMKLGRS